MKKSKAVKALHEEYIRFLKRSRDSEEIIESWLEAKI